MSELLALKKEISQLYPNFEENVTKAWREIVTQLSETAEEISAGGPKYIPQVKFSEINSLSPEKIQEIKRKGTVVIKDVVDDVQAAGWKSSLEAFIKENPDKIDGFPEGDMQFFQLYWTKAQVEARSHPNMLATQVWLNNLYDFARDNKEAGVDLNTPLSYADRFRIRHPGGVWGVHPPHVDSGSIERWQDPAFRSCFSSIFSGEWGSHNPYELSGRLDARSSLYGRPNQSSVFRTFQGWLAMSKIGPTRGTLRVFPDVLLSNAYLILRPFVSPTVGPDSNDHLKPENWKFDISYPEFPGIQARDGGYSGPKPTPEEHPHLFLEKTMTSIPEVSPGDMVYWHSDVVHAVEQEHLGNEDSAVMYIPAVPTTPLNKAYVEKQNESFVKGVTPPDFPKVPVNEVDLVGRGMENDILSPLGRRAMGFPIAVA